MIIAKIIGTIISTLKHPAYANHKLFMVQPLHLAEQTPDETFIAIDQAQAGVGDTVLVLREGSGARQILSNETAPIISVIVGILDSVEIMDIL